MKMQDKEFDRLFNAKLSDFEMEPSAQVWQNVSREMDGKKVKRSIIPYLSIAASVIIIAAVTTLFFNKTAKKGDQLVKLVKVKPVKPLSMPGTNVAPVFTDKGDDTYLKEAAVATVKAKKPEQVSKVPQVEQINEEIAVTSPSLVAQRKEPVLAVSPAEKPALLQPVATGNVISVTTLVTEPKEISEAPGYPIIDPIFEKSPAKKRAHGLGGFINTIVAAVDKREDKLIEFTDADNDEGTRVTAVNLGIFKIKKQ